MFDPDSIPPIAFPAAPPGGGYLVLNKTQMANPDLLAAIAYIYPNTRIVAQQQIPDHRRPAMRAKGS